jgi:tetratricopeptide (TPR) repeat protein
VAHLLRKRRKELGLRLRDVERQTAEAGEVIPISTLSRIERARLDPGQTRLGLLLRLYRIPYQSVGDLLELEAFAGEMPAGEDTEQLYKEGIARWKNGDLKGGMAHLLALRVRPRADAGAGRSRQEALLAFAIMAASLGKYRLSREILDDLLVEPLGAPLLFQCLVQAGVTWNGLGAPEVALAFLERAEGHVAPTDHQQRAWALHEKATALRHSGETEAAESAARSAIAAYRKAGDTYGESLALGARVKIREAAGDWRAALVAARRGSRHAKKHGYGRLIIFRRIEEGRALAALGQTAEGTAVLNRALADAVAVDDKSALFHAHFHLSRAYEALGDRSRAEVERNAARYFVQFVDEASEEALEIRGDADTSAVRGRVTS